MDLKNKGINMNYYLKGKKVKAFYFPILNNILEVLIKMLFIKDWKV